MNHQKKSKMISVVKNRFILVANFPFGVSKWLSHVEQTQDEPAVTQAEWAQTDGDSPAAPLPSPACPCSAAGEAVRPWTEVNILISPRRTKPPFLLIQCENVVSYWKSTSKIKIKNKTTELFFSNSSYFKEYHLRVSSYRVRIVQDLIYHIHWT